MQPSAFQEHFWMPWFVIGAKYQVRLILGVQPMELYHRTQKGWTWEQDVALLWMFQTWAGRCPAGMLPTDDGVLHTRANALGYRCSLASIKVICWVWSRHGFPLWQRSLAGIAGTGHTEGPLLPIRGLCLHARTRSGCFAANVQE